MRWLFALILIGGLILAVGLDLIRRKRQGQDPDAEPEKELSLREQMIMGTAVVQPKPRPDEEKTLMEKVYSGKGHQPRYMRYIADHERRRAIEAAKLAEEKEHQKPIDE